jgi:hypothetical protein
MCGVMEHYYDVGNGVGPCGMCVSFDGQFFRDGADIYNVSKLTRK